MLNKEVLVMPVEANETAELGIVNGHTHTETTVNGKKDETTYYLVNEVLVDEARVKEIGDTLTIDGVTYTIVDVSTQQNQIILKNDYDSEMYTFEPTDIYYCEDCDELHFSDAPMVDDLDDDEEVSEDFILGHLAGYISGAKDMYDHYDADGDEFTIIEEALDRIGLDFPYEIFDTRRLENMSYDELIEFYNAVTKTKEERANHVDEDEVPTYTHDDIVKLIGHDFNEA